LPGVLELAICFVVLLYRSAVLMGRGLPGTPRNKILSKVFVPVYDGNKQPAAIHPAYLRPQLLFTNQSTEVIPAALQERGEEACS